MNYLLLLFNLTSHSSKVFYMLLYAYLYLASCFSKFYILIYTVYTCLILRLYRICVRFYSDRSILQVLGSTLKTRSETRIRRSTTGEWRPESTPLPPACRPPSQRNRYCTLQVRHSHPYGCTGTEVLLFLASSLHILPLPLVPVRPNNQRPYPSSVLHSYYNEEIHNPNARNVRVLYVCALRRSRRQWAASCARWSRRCSR